MQKIWCINKTTRKDIFDFLKYFRKYYIRGTLKNWQMFKSESNMPMTSNRCESFNAFIKRVLTERKRFNIIEIIEEFENCLKFLKNENIGPFPLRIRQEEIDQAMKEKDNYQIYEVGQRIRYSIEKRVRQEKSQRN